MRLTFTLASVQDLKELRSYIAQDNPGAAARMAEAIIAAADRLIENPRLGRPDAVSGTFESVIRPYVLVYEIHGDHIVVLRVWHGRQRRPGT